MANILVRFETIEVIYFTFILKFIFKKILNIKVTSTGIIYTKKNNP